MTIKGLTQINITKLIILIFTILAAFLMTQYNFKLYKYEKHAPSENNKVHILQWTQNLNDPFKAMGKGNSVFVRNKCKHTNCYITNDTTYLRDVKSFDAVIFNGRDSIHEVPPNRSLKQKYIFAVVESPDNCPQCDKKLDGFFNWTWTYKLDSDLPWRYLTIYDLEGNIIGPAKNINWLKVLKPIKKELKTKLSEKSKIAAWFVSHCSTKSRRERFVNKLQTELQLFGWKIDVYGRCGTLSCPRQDEKLCLKMVEKKYYFYLSFENSFCEDYVTEKLLIALNNFAVPVVYGGADYSRFLPPGSYLDAKELGPKNLARQMIRIIANQTMYYDFFRWRNHYVYKRTLTTADMCKLCKVMNDKKRISQVTVWNNFSKWWNGANAC